VSILSSLSLQIKENCVILCEFWILREKKENAWQQ
jgi:hypothetical protein